MKKLKYDYSELKKRYGLPEEEIRDMIRQQRVNRAYVELNQDLPDHIDNLVRMYEVYKEKFPGDDDSPVPMEESYRRILEYLERLVQLRGKLWPEK